MTLPKQKANESDADYAVRLEAAREARREYNRKYREVYNGKEATKEHQRQYYEANKEAYQERSRKWRKANPEACREQVRRYKRRKTLAHAKGKPLRSDLQRAQRPVMLTRLILQEAEKFCLKWGFEVERKLDTDVIRQAARTIRDSVDLNGEPNPWYCTDYLHESLISGYRWAGQIRQSYRKRA